MSNLELNTEKKRTPYEIDHVEGGVPVKRWTHGVPVEPDAIKQLLNVAKLPFVGPWVSAMPDMHVGIGATIGSVIPTDKAIIPAAVGVDLGCGMMAVRTTLTANDLPDNLAGIRAAIEWVVPHGRSKRGRDKGSWETPPDPALLAWKGINDRFEVIVAKHPAIRKSNNVVHLGTLGTGNHFIEICLDTEQNVWVMLHSGSRGVGNRIGRHFIEKARKDMERWQINLPDRDLAYFPEGTDHYDDYVEAVGWAQDFARINRELMMKATLETLRANSDLPPFIVDAQAVNCHHNYINKETHFGKELWVTRKGAVSAQKGQLGIIPGSMGTRSYIVRGKGNPESFCSCSHGAGRAMSRTAAKKAFTLADHAKATEGIECRKDAAVIDETPAAYKSIEKVMAAQSDLVEVVHELRQVVCVKG